MQNSQVSPQQAAQELLRRRRARESLRTYTKYTFPEFEESAHHSLIIDALERVEAKVESGEGARLMIFMPPRHTKSELASRRFPAWTVGKHPNWQFIMSTYSGDFAADFGRDVRRIVKTRAHQNIFPGASLAEDSQAASRWNTSEGGSYVASGVGGSLTGRGAHIALIDDPFKDWQAAYSSTIRESVWKWYLTVLRTRLMPGGAIIIIMTRWHDDDLAGRLIKQAESGEGEEWEILSLPALAKGGDPLGREQGEALWPQWFDRDNLETTRKLMPSFEWEALYQQDPVPETGDLIKRDWFKWYDQQPKHLNYYLTFDAALTEDGGDYTVMIVWGVDHNGDIYAVDHYRDQVTMDVWVDVLLEKIRRYPLSYVVSEVGNIRRAAEPYIKKAMERSGNYAVLKWLPHVGDKIAGCAAFRGMASMGQIYLPRNKEWSSVLLDELMKFPAGAHDDQVDACGLIGRAINQTWAAKVPVKPVKQDMHRKPTLGEMLAAEDSKDDWDERI